MKKLLLCAALLACGAGGCIKMHVDTVIEKSGAGTMTLSYGVSQEVAAALKEMGEMPDQQLGQQVSPGDFDRDKLEAAARQHGVTIKKFDRRAADGRETIEIALAFPSLEKFNAVQGSMGGAASGLALFKNAGGDYVLRAAPAGAEDSEEEEQEAEAAPPAEDFDPQQMQKAMELMGKLMAHASELDVRMTLTVPGDVISHNAMRAEGRTLIWEINSQNMMSMASEAAGFNPEVVFSGKGLSLPAQALPE